MPLNAVCVASCQVTWFADTEDFLTAFGAHTTMDVHDLFCAPEEALQAERLVAGEMPRKDHLSSAEQKRLE